MAHALTRRRLARATTLAHGIRCSNDHDGVCEVDSDADDGDCDSSSIFNVYMHTQQMDAVTPADRGNTYNRLIRDAYHNTRKFVEQKHFIRNYADGVCWVYLRRARSYVQYTLCTLCIYEFSVENFYHSSLRVIDIDKSIHLL